MGVGLSLPRIRNFVAVAEERQFRRAAERVGLSQPALSAQLRELEEFLGTALLSRTTRSVHLTAEGEKFLLRARNILADLESAVLEVRDHASLRRGRLAVASIPSVASRILPGIVASFTERYPGIDVQVIELGARDVERCVAGGNADLGIAAAPDRNSELTFSFMLRDRLRWAGAALQPAGASAQGAVGRLVRVSPYHHGGRHQHPLDARARLP